MAYTAADIERMVGVKPQRKKQYTVDDVNQMLGIKANSLTKSDIEQIVKTNKQGTGAQVSGASAQPAKKLYTAADVENMVGKQQNHFGVSNKKLYPDNQRIENPQPSQKSAEIKAVNDWREQNQDLFQTWQKHKTATGYNARGRDEAIVDDSGWNQLTDAQKMAAEEWGKRYEALGLSSAGYRLGKTVEGIGRKTAASVPLVFETAGQMSDDNAVNQSNKKYTDAKAALDQVEEAIQLRTQALGDAVQYDYDGIAIDAELEALYAKQKALQATVAQEKVSNPVSKESKAYKAFDKGQQRLEEAQTGLSNGEKFAYGVGTSVAQNAAMLPMEAVVPGSGLAMMGALSAADTVREETEKGTGASKAMGRALASGLIEAGTEKIGLDTLTDVVKGSSKSAVKNVIKNGLEKAAGAAGGEAVANMLSEMTAEGLEEVVGYMANYAVDKVSKEPDAEFSWSELLQNFAAGALAGGILGAGGTAVNTLQNKKQQNAIELQNQNAMHNIPSLTSVKKQPSEVVQGQPVGISQAQGEIPMLDGIIEPAVRSDEQQNTMKKPRNEQTEIVEKLRENVASMIDMDFVTRLKGNEFQSGEKKLSQMVAEFFDSIGNKVARKGFGEIILNKRSIKDDMAHGIGRQKAITFAAVPDVISKGRQIDFQPNWKGRGYDTYVFAAPVKVGEETNYVAAVVVSSLETNRHYLHEVIDENGNIIYKRKDAENAIKTGSIDGNTISPGSVSASFETSIPQLQQNARVIQSKEKNTGIPMLDSMRVPPSVSISQLSGAKPQAAPARVRNIELEIADQARAEKMQAAAQPSPLELHSQLIKNRATPKSVDELPTLRPEVLKHEQNSALPKLEDPYTNAQKPEASKEKDPMKIDSVKEMLNDEDAGFGEGLELAPEMTVQLQNKGVSYYKDLSRNLDAAAGKNIEVREYLRKAIELPTYRAKAKYAKNIVQVVTNYKKAMDMLGIKKGSAEAKAVMWYGEGRKKAKTEYKPYELEDLKREFPQSWENIVKANEVNRQLYDTYLREINEALEAIYPNALQDAKTKRDNIAARIEYYKKLLAKETDTEERTRIEANISLASGQFNALQKDIESGEVLRNKRLFGRADFYHHAQEGKDGFGALAGILSTKSDISTNLVGVSDFTKPKTKFAGFMQARQGGMNYTEDSISAMLDYIEQAQYKVDIDPLIARNRSVIKSLAETTKATRNANQFIEWMTDWTNDLAGKTNPGDRYKQKEWRRKWIQTLKWLNNRVKANAVVGNVNTAVAQFFNLPNMFAYIKNPSDMGAGAKMWGLRKLESLGMMPENSGASASNLIRQSGFLTERYGIDQAMSSFDEGILHSPKKLANFMLTFGDQQVSEYIWLSAYNKAVRENASDPVMVADDITRRSVAGRGIGEVPIDQKTLLTQMLAPFQVEVNNTWQLLKERVDKKDALGILMIFIASWLMNNLSEELTGRRIAFDPIDAMLDGIQATKDEKGDDATWLDYAGSAMMRMAGETITNIPKGSLIAQTLVGLPVNDNRMQKIFGDNDPTRFGVGNIGLGMVVDPALKLLAADDPTSVNLLAPVMNVVLPGGAKQAERTLTAAQDMGMIEKGPFGLPFLGEKQKVPGSYTSRGELRFPIDTESKANVLAGLALGTWGTKEGKEYTANGSKAFSKKNTETITGGTVIGLKPPVTVDVVNNFKGIENLQSQNLIPSLDPKLQEYVKQNNLQIGNKSEAKRVALLMDDSLNTEQKVYLASKLIDDKDSTASADRNYNSVDEYLFSGLTDTQKAKFDRTKGFTKVQYARAYQTVKGINGKMDKIIALMNEGGYILEDAERLYSMMK